MRFFWRQLIAAAFVCGLGSAALAQQPRVVPQSHADAVLSFSPIVKKASPAVVNVFATAHRAAAGQSRSWTIRSSAASSARAAAAPRGPTAQSLGSGVIVDAGGLVVTNNHVIEGMTDVKVSLADKREIPAKILLRDPRTDLAVLKLTEGADLPHHGARRFATRSRSAISRSPSAIPSASARR